MAESYGFFDGDNLYGQDEFNRYFDNIYESGISINKNGNMTLNCYVNNNNNIIVESGFAIVKGFYLYNDSNKTIAVTRDSNYNRIDRMVVRLNLSTKKVTIEHKQGIAGSNPVAPTLQRDNLVYELSLCQLNVPTSGNITVVDERFRSELCGAIRPKNMTEYKDMVKQFQSQFDKWFDSQQAKGWRNIYIQPGQPVDSVVGNIWIKELT